MTSFAHPHPPRHRRPAHLRLVTAPAGPTPGRRLGALGLYCAGLSLGSALVLLATLLSAGPGAGMYALSTLLFAAVAAVLGPVARRQVASARTNATAPSSAGAVRAATPMHVTASATGALRRAA